MNTQPVNLQPYTNPNDAEWRKWAQTQQELSSDILAVPPDRVMAWIDRLALQALDIANLRAERDAALEQVRVLKNYAHHDGGCMYNHTDKCTCGLFASLNTTAPVQLETLRKQVRVLRNIVSRYHSAHSFLDDGEGCELCDDAEASLNPSAPVQQDIQKGGE